MSKQYLKYNDDDKELRRMIQIFRSMNYNWSKEDDEYNNNINECMRNAELKTVEDCLEFFRTWISIYKDVRSEWDEAAE